MAAFTRKGYGRIFCQKEEDVETVYKIIKELDEFEFDYIPSGFVVPVSEFPNLVFTGKFDALDKNVITAACLRKGIIVICFDNAYDEFFHEILTKNESYVTA